MFGRPLSLSELLQVHPPAGSCTLLQEQHRRRLRRRKETWAGRAQPQTAGAHGNNFGKRSFCRRLKTLQPEPSAQCPTMYSKTPDRTGRCTASWAAYTSNPSQTCLWLYWNHRKLRSDSRGSPELSPLNRRSLSISCVQQSLLQLRADTGTVRLSSGQCS